MWKPTKLDILIVIVGIFVVLIPMAIFDLACYLEDHEMESSGYPPVELKTVGELRALLKDCKDDEPLEMRVQWKGWTWGWFVGHLTRVNLLLKTTYMPNPGKGAGLVFERGEE